MEKVVNMSGYKKNYNGRQKYFYLTSFYIT